MDDQSSFFSKLNSLLGEDGVVSVHVSGDVRAVDSISTKRRIVAGRRTERQSRIATELANAGFQATKQYEETETGLIQSRHYVVAFKDLQTAEKWNRNEAEINTEIRKRSAATSSGKPAFKFFDGATMTSYSRASSKETEMQGAVILHEMKEKAINKVAPSPTMDAVPVSAEDTTSGTNQSLEVDECGAPSDVPHGSELGENTSAHPSKRYTGLSN
jgi:hypothetical protein